MDRATIELAGTAVELLAGRAIYWPEGRVLLVADAHLGKADAFRAGGVTAPSTTDADLVRLSALLDSTGATLLVFLGDLLHARAGRSAALDEAFVAWRAARPALRVVLVRGNHDIGAGDPPEAWGVECVDEPWPLGPFALRHFPEACPGAYALAGHVHPGVLLRGAGRQQLRLPCFHFAPAVGTLPAFGSFTGLGEVRPARGDRVWVVADDRLVDVTPASRGS